ncbi:OmpA family protein [Hymenobacter rubidus]|uniref:OmpA family protein n=1 Tax=Hymenobacter rubidus TaxID=1441626 RepID=UPI00191DADC2|nr:OmpA family protein [Hymenobacter rubidus]
MSTYTRFLLACALATGALFTAQAQNVLFNSQRFQNEEALKGALKAIKEGQDEYNAVPPRYAAALPHFQEAQKLNPNNGPLNLRIGNCYLNMGDAATALPYLEKAAELEPAATRNHYVLGQAYQQSARWGDALKEYTKAKPVAVGAPRRGQSVDVPLPELIRRVTECKNGMQLMAKPTRLFMDNLGPTVNSPEADYNPVVTADETTLFFTSRRAGSQGGEKDPGGSGYTDDIYSTVGGGLAWGPSRNINAPVNTNGADVTVALSADGQRMLLHTEGNMGNLSETRLTAAGWSKPHELGSHINTKYQETSASFSADGRYIYYVSDKPEGSLGGKDIYKAEIDGKTPPVNLGGSINTPYNEEAVFMASDGKTLYFSSEGHNSMGGYDIFKSVYANGKWGEPENLGWPINTPSDDVFFVTVASGRIAYLASNRPGGFGGKDIYRITLLGDEKQPAINQEDRLLSTNPRPMRQVLPSVTVPVITPDVTLLKGTVTDVATMQPVFATIEVVDNLTGQTINTFQTTASGKYLLSLPAGANYALVLHNDAYLFHSENVSRPPDAGYAEAVKNIRMQKMEPGSNIVLNNVFFDPDKAVLRPESTAELDRVRKLLEDSPKLKLQVSGHTDNVGPPDANQNLSERRAQAIKDYLVQHKISADRLTATGYGGTIPITANTTEAGRQMNRRVEFKVLAR